MNWKILQKTILSLTCYLLCTNLSAQNKKLYMIPGQGSDTRLFKHLVIEGYDTVGINYVIPEKNEGMNDLARRMASEIDTTESFALLGVSLGGMLAMEMCSFMNPDKIILISSAKNENEIPKMYRMFRKLPINKIIGGNFLKFCTVLFQPIYEPLGKEDQILWRTMFKEKDPKFMKRASDCIINWEGYANEGIDILHIHGSKDRTLPIKNIGEHERIENGTHIMTLTEAEKISELVNGFL